MLIRDLVVVDDWGLFLHTEEDFQALTDSFARAKTNFSLTISIKRPLAGSTHIGQAITIAGEQLEISNAFIYLGGIL